MVVSRHKIYSGIPHISAGVFLMKRLLVNPDRYMIVVDDWESYNRIIRLIPHILGKKVKVISHLGEVFAQEGESESLSIIHTRVLTTRGNQEEQRRKTSLRLERNMSIPIHTLIDILINLGYTQDIYLCNPYTYKREGSVIHIWYGEREYRIEYFGDEIESIIERYEEKNMYKDILVIPKIPGDIGGKEGTINPLLFPIFSSWRGICICCEFLQEKELLKESFLSTEELSMLSVEGSEKLKISHTKIETLDAFRKHLEEYPDTQIYTRYKKRVSEFLRDNQIENRGIYETKEMIESFVIEKGYISHYEEPSSQISLIGDDVIGKIFIENRIRRSRIRNLDLLLHIREGDLVVHREHGIGRYIAIVKKRVGLIEREYMEIEYANNARIYVPLIELHRITKYIGEHHIELSQLEGKEWERSLSKTEEEVEIIAQDIIKTSAERILKKGIRFGSFPEEEKIFEKAFPYEHTEDQKAIIREVYTDMESEIPMDRLISGDVGFGKTEIAMNAIYKAVLSGMQVAVISPLLILAEEHYETFQERLGAFGVRIGLLTRMTKKKEEKDIREQIRTGNLDVIVGTHRLLGDDIRFRRLGLLVIDEEHRFGVNHKEAIKRIKSHIDVLSLSATPIPRTLHMALSGLKKISLLTTPPPRKKPIQTLISRWDIGVIRQAIQKEISRGGQVIILHNRIASLQSVEEEIREIVDSLTLEEALDERHREGDTETGDATIRGKKIQIVTLHGRMTGEEIDDRIHRFKKGEYTLLISTTVIENGVNFLGANTIIISDAEEFGLAQLHQIRGRIGRKDIAGVCYLMYRKYELSQEERKRLMILAEHSYLGSGYEIALRDLEMRGTGDILGFRQSGKTKEVGISLYFQLLEEKIEEIRNGKKKDEKCKIDLDISYSIDDEYFDSEMDKVSFFRDIDSIETLEDLEYAESTFSRTPMTTQETVYTRQEDNTGLSEISGSHRGGEDYETSFSNLFLSLRASIILTEYHVKRVSKIGNHYHFDFHEGTRPDDLRRFLDRFDVGGNMVIVSIAKIRVDTGLWKGAREFLEFLTR